MNSFDENQNIENIEAAEEVSTVFSDPTAHKINADGKKNANKKRITTIIAGVLAVALLVGTTIAVVKLIPEKKDDDGTSSTIPQIEVLTVAEEEMQKLTVKNENGSFVLNNEIEEDEDGDEECVWSIEGYDIDVIDDYALYNIASNFMNLTAIREITTKTDEQCGLTAPKITADIIKTDNSTVSVLVGDKSPDNSGTYVKLAGSDEIYLVSGGIDESLSFKALDLANTEALQAIQLPDGHDDYISNDVVATFDTITVSGKNFDKKVVIEPNSDETLSNIHPFVLTAPIKRYAENYDVALALFNTTISVTGAYSLDVKPETIKALGLDSPDVEVTGKFGEVTYTYKFKKQEDGSYAVWHTDCKHIKQVSADTTDMFLYNTRSFYSTWVHLQSIDELSGFIVRSEGKEYKFDITVDKSEDAKERYVIKYNGKKLTASNFQEFYQYCIAFTASDFDPQEVTGTPDYEFTYIYSDTSQKSVKIAFYRVSATKYQFSVDGEQVGHTNASDVNRIANYVKQVSEDKTITVA